MLLLFVLTDAKWIQGLPKALRDALENLASEAQILILTAYIEEVIAAYDEEPDPFEFEPRQAPVVEWGSGVEEYQSMSTDGLWERLGVPGKTIPFFNPSIDIETNKDPWLAENKQFFKSSGVQPLTMRWHQLVGLLKMVERTFEGKPVVLMDEVGMGKTMQVVALMCVLEFYRIHYSEHGTFPGAFREFDSSLQLSTM